MRSMAVVLISLLSYVPDKDAHWSGPAAFADAFRL